MKKLLTLLTIAIAFTSCVEKTTDSTSTDSTYIDSTTIVLDSIKTSNDTTKTVVDTIVK